MWVTYRGPTSEAFLSDAPVGSVITVPRLKTLVTLTGSAHEKSNAPGYFSCPLPAGMRELFDGWMRVHLERTDDGQLELVSPRNK
jgi:hypothetical protein